MIFDFKFWRYFTKQGKLIHNLNETEMRGFGPRVFLVLLFGVLTFALPEVWGMNTASLTPYMAAGMEDTYLLARYVSLFGVLIWAGVYLSFHLYGAAFAFHRITDMPWRAALVMQLYVVALLIIEKALNFIIFSLAGFTMPVSILSFGPLAATFLDAPFLTFFFNQLTVVTALIIALQYRFVRAFTTIPPKKLLFILLLIHVAIALFVASFSLMPVEEWLVRFTEGGVPVE